MIVNGIEYSDEDGEFFPDRSVRDATLLRDTVIQALPCAGGRSVVYYPGGRLRLAWLSRSASVGRIVCLSGIVYLHENGGALNVGLAEAQRFGTVDVPEGGVFRGGRVQIGLAGDRLPAGIRDFEKLDKKLIAAPRETAAAIDWAVEVESIGKGCRVRDFW